ncbi:hypothetical protein [Ruminococcus gauvreauii]|uniref:DUF3784 domain-containing protein n=1 Tax=Ruminococcus gauvreauii TaxID=438033 RepID=A0ABY5VI91_9FIRM|nr:hypothetical protein [Ruminococcus gauvreauii]UWP59926.1 hypothetical protein NQ502_02375 [Ruminococcus gauvreauii]
MIDKIINVAIAVVCLIAAGQCGKYSASAFMGKGKIPLNVYSLVKNGQKRDLSKMSDEERKRSYRTAAYVFLGFTLALMLLFVGFIMEMFQKSGEMLFLAAIVIEVIEVILIFVLIRKQQ